MTESVLSDVSLEFRRGEACVLLGPSGSGKTTLLSILGCLLSPTRGDVHIEDVRVPNSQGELVAIRRDKIGFVFQHAQLLGFLSVEDNLRIIGKNAGLDKRVIQERIWGDTQQLGISENLKRKPVHLSGGQRQRVAIARALIHRPPIILADEPTAALDWNNGQAVIQLLLRQARTENALLIVVTHDTRLVNLFDRVLQVESGKVREL